MEQADLIGLDARIWQALIAGFFVSIGWLVNGWRTRRAAAALRAERLRDAHRAIFAEIAVNIANLWSNERLDESADAMVARMRSEPGFIPFVARDKHDRLFSALEAEIHVLPRVTIDPIVRYYAQITAIDMMVEDMRSTEFRLLDVERRIALYEHLIEMRKTALTFGREANRLISVFSEEGKDAAEAEARRLSSRQARAPSDR